MSQILNGPEKESKGKPVTKPSPRTNRNKDKSDPRKTNPSSPGKI